MKQFIFVIVIGFLFVLGCSQKRDTIETNTWDKFKEIPTYKTTTKVNKITSISDTYEDTNFPPAEMPLVVSTSYRDGYNDAISSSKAKVSNQKDYLDGFREGIKDKKDGIKKRLIVR